MKKPSRKFYVKIEANDTCPLSYGIFEHKYCFIKKHNCDGDLKNRSCECPLQEMGMQSNMDSNLEMIMNSLKRLGDVIRN